MRKSEKKGPNFLGPKDFQIISSFIGQKYWKQDNDENYVKLYATCGLCLGGIFFIFQNVVYKSSMNDYFTADFNE